METAITKGIKVSVTITYQPDYSSPMQMHYVFTYKVIIENHSDHTIQLLRRHWHIHDANHEVREVEGKVSLDKCRYSNPENLIIIFPDAT